MKPKYVIITTAVTAVLVMRFLDDPATGQSVLSNLVDLFLGK